MIHEQEITTKSMSLFLIKNSFGSKMKKGFRNFCNGESSTSTLDQQKVNDLFSSSQQKPLVNSPSRVTRGQPTLEEMILQLETEEKNMGRKGFEQHRMSCVNSSDILRTARNALNQYPRFSLDGKDAMYRSSFTNNVATMKSRATTLPCVIGGESVIWCKAGVVAKLMGLDAMPIPLNSISYRRERLSAIIRRQNLRKRAERHENERRKLMGDRRREVAVGMGSCSRTPGYCIMKPIDLEIPNGEAGWPIRRFL